MGLREQYANWGKKQAARQRDATWRSNSPRTQREAYVAGQPSIHTPDEDPYSAFVTRMRARGGDTEQDWFRRIPASLAGLLPKPAEAYAPSVGAGMAPVGFGPAGATELPTMLAVAAATHPKGPAGFINENPGLTVALASPAVLPLALEAGGLPTGEALHAATVGRAARLRHAQTPADVHANFADLRALSGATLDNVPGALPNSLRYLLHNFSGRGGRLDFVPEAANTAARAWKASRRGLKTPAADDITIEEALRVWRRVGGDHDALNALYPDSKGTADVIRSIGGMHDADPTLLADIQRSPVRMFNTDGADIPALNHAFVAYPEGGAEPFIYDLYHWYDTRKTGRAGTHSAGPPNPADWNAFVDNYIANSMRTVKLKNGLRVTIPNPAGGVQNSQEMRALMGRLNTPFTVKSPPIRKPRK